MPGKKRGIVQAFGSKKRGYKPRGRHGGRPGKETVTHESMQQDANRTSGMDSPTEVRV